MVFPTVRRVGCANRRDVEGAVPYGKCSLTREQDKNII